MTGDDAMAGIAASLLGVGVDTGLLAVLLQSVGFSVAFGMSPALSSHGMPAMVRVVLVFVLSALAAPALPGGMAPGLAGWSASWLMAAVHAEVFVGMLLGFGVHVVLASFSIAGRMLDVQIGFGIGSVFDPVTRSSQNVMGMLMSLVGVTLFFAMDAHLALASMLARSTTLFPLGALPDFADPMPLLSGAGRMYAIGLALAAPVAIALVLSDLLVGVTSRNMPQINVLVLSMPLKVLVAYFVLAVSVRAWAPLLSGVFGMAGDILGAN